MPFFNELAITVLGGVLTALILSLFARRRPRRDVEAARLRAAEPARRPIASAFGNFIQLVLAVLGGVAFAIVGGRMLFQADILQRSLPMRVALLVGGTTVIWLLLSAMRRR